MLRHLHRGGRADPTRARPTWRTDNIAGVSAAPLYVVLPLAVILVVIAAAAALMAVRGRRGALTRSGRLGVHTPAAMASDEAFTIANRVAAPVAAGAAAVAGVLAVLVVVLPVATGATVVIGLVGLVGSLALLIAAGLLGDRAARMVPVPARRPGSAATGSCSGCACGGGGCAGISRNDPAAAAGSA